jgi:hypothetical protein
MKKTMNAAPARIGIILLVVTLALSSGCVNKILLPDSGGDTGGPSPLSEFTLTTTSSPTAEILPIAPTAVSTPVGMITPSGNLDVNELDPTPYFTPDLYALPYRDHGNWTTIDPARVIRAAQFRQKIVLRSNTSVFRVNVTKGPLVVDLAFNPVFPDPDQTSMVGGMGEESGEKTYGVSVTSFVHSNAEVSIFDETSGGEPVAMDGYRGVYSNDPGKRITVYREGPHIITLSGNYVDVVMFITTGSAPEITPVPTPEAYDEWDESEEW